MAWTAPMTAVANAVFTAAQFNTHVRDNFLETAPAKATTADRAIVTDGANAIREQAISIITWTPAWALWGIGNAAVDARYRHLFSVVVWRLTITIGSTTSPSGNFAFTVPVDAAAGSVIGSGYVTDTSAGLTGRRVVSVRMTSAATAHLYYDEGQVTATAPFTFANTDQIVVSGAYLGATAFS